MARPKVGDGATVRLCVAVTEAERDLVAAEAKRLGQSLPEHLRAVIRAIGRAHEMNTQQDAARVAREDDRAPATVTRMVPRGKRVAPVESRHAAKVSAPILEECRHVARNPKATVLVCSKCERVRGLDGIWREVK